jgi:HD-like signal output (HDOD) protein
MTSVVSAFDGFPDGSVNMESFWEHSIAVGVTARALGEYRSLPNSASFYIHGLLHDIGRLVMYLKLPGLMHDLLDRRQHSGESLFTLEQQSLGYTYAEIGAKLLEYWKVPESIWQPVLAHHDPQSGGEYLVTASAIHIADAWVNTNLSGSSGSGFPLDIDISALQVIGIDKENLDLIGKSAGVQTKALVRQFMAH